MNHLHLHYTLPQMPIKCVRRLVRQLPWGEAECGVITYKHFGEDQGKEWNMRSSVWSNYEVTYLANRHMTFDLRASLFPISFAAVTTSHSFSFHPSSQKKQRTDLTSGHETEQREYMIVPPKRVSTTEAKNITYCFALQHWKYPIVQSRGHCCSLDTDSQAKCALESCSTAKHNFKAEHISMINVVSILKLETPCILWVLLI